MDSAALALVLTGSLLHLGWNAFAKQATDKLAFMWLALVPAAAAGAGLLIIASARGQIPAAGAACVLASGVAHTAYFWLLARAYAKADLSLVYPYSRGIAAMVASLAGVVLLNESPSTLGWIGICFTTTAAFVEIHALRKSRASLSGLALAVVTGTVIAAYLVIDKVGVRYVSPLYYLPGLLVLPCASMAPMMLRARRAVNELRRSTWRPLLASCFLNAAYGVVLFAMQIAPITYVVAARASGIAASALVGVWIFKEAVTGGRWASLAMIVAGVICIGLA